MAGFVQTYRTLFPISLVGPVSAQEFETAGAALELKLPTRTYLTLQLERLSSEADNTRGVLVTDLSSGTPTPITGSGTREQIDFTEHSAEITASQLLGDAWTVGARYRFASAELQTRLPCPSRRPADTRDTSDLHAGGVFALYNHRCGFLAQSDFTWFAQDNRTRRSPAEASPRANCPRRLPDVENEALGWRFPRQRGDVTFSI